MDEQERKTLEKKIWDDRAPRYDHSMAGMFDEAYRQSIERALALCQPGQRVLEIGCGTGILSLGIARKAAEVVGVDLSEAMIAQARAKAAAQGLRNVQFQVQDGYSIPFADESFDGVMIYNLLHVVQDPAAVLQEARRLVKPGGWLATATDCYADPVSWGQRLRLSAQDLLHRLGVIPVMSNFKRADLERLVDQAGWRIEARAVLHPAPVNYFLAARKAS